MNVIFDFRRIDMPRNLDLTALRSFVAVAETGGVTKAAGFLNLTQSAVSMQLKRLEEGLGLDLLDRSGRGIALTGTGEQLLGYARRMLALNDEVYTRLTSQEFEGEIALGVPHEVAMQLEFLAILGAQAGQQGVVLVGNEVEHARLPLAHAVGV